MRIFIIGALTLILAAPAFAGEAAPEIQSQPQTQTQFQAPRNPVTDMDSLLQQLRDLDSSQDDDGDHVVGEMLC